MADPHAHTDSINILSFPNELLSPIFQHLVTYNGFSSKHLALISTKKGRRSSSKPKDTRPIDLLALCQTCARFRQIAQQILFTHACFPRREPACSHFSQIFHWLCLCDQSRKGAGLQMPINFILSISMRPDLAAAIKTVTVARWSADFRFAFSKKDTAHETESQKALFKANWKNEEIRGTFRLAVEKFGLTKAQRKRLQWLFRRSRDPEVILLLLLARNVSVLRLDYSGWCDSFVAYKFRYSLRSELLAVLRCGTTGYTDGFQNIKTLTISAPNVWAFGEPRVHVDEILSLPSLTRLMIEGDLDCSKSISFSPSLETPTSTTLRYVNISLGCCPDHSIPAVKKLLQKCTRLETFRLEVEHWDTLIRSSNMDPGIAADACLSVLEPLTLHCQSLQNLDLILGIASGDGMPFPRWAHAKVFELLRRYTVLDDLSLSETLLVNFSKPFVLRYDRHARVLDAVVLDMRRINDLGVCHYEELLPGNIRSLTIHHATQASLVGLQNLPQLRHSSFLHLEKVTIEHLKTLGETMQERYHTDCQLLHECEKLKASFRQARNIELILEKLDMWKFRGTEEFEVANAVEEWFQARSAEGIQVDSYFP